MSARPSSVASAASDASAPAGLPRWGVGALICAAAIATFHGALALYFAQDDFAGLARARGLLEPLEGPWRYLSGQFYFVVMKAVGGLDPLPYRVANLAAHLATSLLLLAWLLRRTSLPAAWVGATFFAVHPASFTALYSISGIGEIMALGFALAALLLVTRAGPARWLALPAYALSLASKESTLLLPAIAMIECRHARRRAPTSGPAPLRDPVLLAMAVIAAAYLAYFVTSVAGRQFGLTGDAAARASAPYALAFDDAIVWNLLTYAGWTLHILLPTVRGVADVVQTTVTPSAAIAMLAWLAGLAWPALRRRGWLAGGVLYLAFLAPVLPLPHHTYHYHLYSPLAGAALCVAALADRALQRAPAARAIAPRGRRAEPERVSVRAPAWPWWIAGGLAVLLTVNGALLVRKIEHHPFIHPDLRSDSTVDRACIARHVRDGLRAAGPPPGAHVRFWSPIAIEIEQAAGRDTASESYWERNVRQALLDGLAVRTMFPEIASVAFVRRFEPADASTYYAVYAVDGRLRLVSAAELGKVVRDRERTGAGR